MACELSKPPEMTLADRKREIKETIEKLSRLLATGTVKPVVSKTNRAIAFAGWDDKDRNRVTDACAYRQIMVHGSALAKAAIAQAERIAGVTVDRQVIGQGVHSHDGGKTWHHGH